MVADKLRSEAKIMGCVQMIDKVQVTISACNFERMCKIHDAWRMLKDSVMAEQDVNYVIERLLSIAEGKRRRLK